MGQAAVVWRILGVLSDLFKFRGGGGATLRRRESRSCLARLDEVVPRRSSTLTMWTSRTGPGSEVSSTIWGHHATSIFGLSQMLFTVREDISIWYHTTDSKWSNTSSLLFRGQVGCRSDAGAVALRDAVQAHTCCMSCHDGSDFALSSWNPPLLYVLIPMLRFRCSR